MEYKLEDLSVALADYEKIKSTFEPLFDDIENKEEIGSQQEEIHALVLTSGKVKIIIRMIQYNLSNHTLSVEYTDTWKEISE